jgi:formate C-acetyltransferase
MSLGDICWPKIEASPAAPDRGRSSRIDEALAALRHKDVRSTTFERLRLTHKADRRAHRLAQPLQLGTGLYDLLDHISLPVAEHDLILGRISECVPDVEQERFYRATVDAWGGRGIPPWMRDGGHECFAWDRLLKLGLPGLQAVVQGELRHRAPGLSQAQLDYLRGAVRVYQAFRHYARRYAQAARMAGLDAAAARCARLADHRPRTFAEALQLIWLVGHVYCTMLAQNPTLTFGRIDELLLPFYERDLTRGYLARDDAGDLIEDFYCKNNLILGRGEHQMGGRSAKDTGWTRNLTYDAPQYVVLGGQRADGSPPANDLTVLFLERIVPRFENPVIVLRYTPDLPEPVWQLACAKMRANASMMVYNDQDVIPAMVHAGIAPQQAISYTMHGCNWPDIPGRQRAIHTHFLRLPQIFLDALSAAGDRVDSVDALYERFAALLRREIEDQCDRVRRLRSGWDRQIPGTLRVDDCFLDGPIEHARSWEVGGVRYPTVVFAIAGIATVADCFAAIEELVFVAGQALDTLAAALRVGFAGHEMLRRRCLAAPKFGQDDDRADVHAVRALHIVLSEIDRACHLDSEDALIAFRCLETDMRHL